MRPFGRLLIYGKRSKKMIQMIRLPLSFDFVKEDSMSPPLTFTALTRLCAFYGKLRCEHEFVDKMIEALEICG